MTTDISSSSADTAGVSSEQVSSNVDTGSKSSTPAAPENIFSGKTVETSQSTEANSKAPANTTQAASSTTPAVGADGKVAYVPNYKYKAASQEKELDPFFHSLIKDADSEKKVKDLFTKVDAFDFVNGKKGAAEQAFQSLASDYETVSNTVTKFNNSVKQGDLSSAFRLAGISKEQIFQWTQKQLQLMDMPPEQRAQYDQFENTKQQKTDLEEQVSQLKTQYQTQAVQARTMQLDMALSRPEVSRFAQAWDQNAGDGAFKSFVVEQAQQAFYTSQQDVSPEQAIAMVMQRFGKFVNVGDTTAQSPQGTAQTQAQRTPPPIIPNVQGKAASPIKKVPKSIEDLKRLAKEARD